MVHLARKTRKGRVYLYLEERAWINGKSRRVWQKYLGREDKLQEMKLTFSPRTLEYQTMGFGPSAALLQVAQKIGLVETIDAIAGKKRYQNLSLGEYLLIAIINRCVAPTSKNQLENWFKRDYLATVFKIDPTVLNSQTYWNHFQFVDEKKIVQIETAIAKRVLREYQVNLSCLLFDPTNFFTYFAEHAANESDDQEQLAKFGHSKEGRNNLRIINVSLLCTLQFGVPLFHKTYEGNVQDAKHFKGLIATLTQRFQEIGKEIEEMVLIFDKGNHSPEAFQDIEATHLPFIASLRNSTQKDLLMIPQRDFTMIVLPSNGKKVGYYRTQRTIYEEQRTVYVLYDPRKHKRATILFEGKLQKKRRQIDAFLTKLNVKKWRSQAKVEAKLKALVGRKPFSEVLSWAVSGSYGQLKVTIQVNEEAKTNYLTTLGRSIIFTTQDEWAPAVVIQAFRDKYVVEDAFKHLKNPGLIAIRPMYHWAEPCIRAHVFTCILGLLLLSLLRMELHQKAICLSYGKMMAALSELTLTQIYTSSSGAPFYKLNRLSSLSSQIYQVLKLKTVLPK